MIQRFGKPIPKHIDCPLCPACDLGAGTFDHVRAERASRKLACAACGYRWTASADEEAQAVAADDAWYALQKAGRV